MEINTPVALPSGPELAVLAAVLGMPDDPWRGGERVGSSTRIAVGLGGGRAAQRSLLLPALIALQQQIGWISKGAVGALAQQLDVPAAEVWGVVTFYDLLDVEPPSREVVLVCTDVVCPSGALRIDELLADGVDARGVPCLGQCDRPYGELTTGPWAVPAGPSLRVGATSSLLAERERYAALRSALEMAPGEVVAMVEAAGLVGRGGAAFPVGVKWRAAAATATTKRFVVCNADESEPGTFKDRLLLEDHADSVLEGLIIAAYAVGAAQGYVYIRGEYPSAHAAMGRAIVNARELGALGSGIAGSQFSFDVEIRSGAGAYICGEETALLNSIEGYRGEPRSKPPFPTEVGLFGFPTVINNVETLANVPLILADGPEAFRAVGTPASPGTKLFSVSGDVEWPGVYELPMGTSLAALLDLSGATDTRAVLLGGAAGSFVKHDDVVLSFEGARAAGAGLGSGSVIVFGMATDFEWVCTRIAEFFAHESCGQCVPCRVGTVRQAEAVALLGADQRQLVVLSDIDRAMTDASICGLGQTASAAIRSAIRLGLLGATDV